MKEPANTSGDPAGGYVTAIRGILEFHYTININSTTVPCVCECKLVQEHTLSGIRSDTKAQLFVGEDRVEAGEPFHAELFDEEKEFNVIRREVLGAALTKQIVKYSLTSTKVSADSPKPTEASLGEKNLSL